MKALGYSLPFIILLCGAVVLGALMSMRQPPEVAERTEKKMLVDWEAAEACTDGFQIHVDGEVIPYREINLSAQVGGRIAAKSGTARAGNYIRKGDVLFEIDARDYELEVRRLQDTLKQAGSSVEELDVEKSNVEGLITLAEEQLELQQADKARFDTLRKKNAVSVSQQDQSRRSELESMNSLQTLKNQISMVRARRNRLLQEKDRAATGLELAVLNLDRTKVTSPINGVVIQDFAEQDDFVQPGARMIQLEDNSKVEVRFSLRMDQLRWLWNSVDSTAPVDITTTPTDYTYDLPDVPVQVRIEVDGNHFLWPARIDRYDGAGIDPRTRTIPVIAVVDDPTKMELKKDEGALPMAAPPTLLRGSYVTVDLTVGKNLQLVSIPVTAYRPNKTVWKFADGKLDIRPVKVAYSDEKIAIVLADPSSLKPGDKVITSPLAVAKEGMALQQTNESKELAQ